MIIQRQFSNIKTHDAVSIPLNSTLSNPTWLPCDGYDKIAVTCLNDAGTSMSVSMFWSNDGTTTNGQDKDFIPAGTINTMAGIVDVKAPYFKVVVYNRDAGAAHVVTAWAYLKG